MLTTQFLQISRRQKKNDGMMSAVLLLGGLSNCSIWDVNIVGYSGEYVSGNPLFVNADAGNFQLQSDSPCIDAGDGTVAPEFDYFGQPRQAKRLQTLETSANGGIPDIGIHEVLPRNATANVDMVATAIEASDAATIGDETIVKWTIRNDGSQDVSGSWRDVISLRSEFGQKIELAEVVSTGFIAQGGEKIISRTLTVPAMPEGDYTVELLVNAYRDIYEGNSIANNVKLGGNINILVEKIGDGSLSLMLEPNEWRIWNISEQAVDGKILTVNASDKIKSSFSQAYTGFPAGKDILTESYVINSFGGYLFVSNPNDFPAELSLNIGLRTQLISVSPKLLDPDLASFDLKINGGGFDRVSSCRLIGGGKIYEATNVSTLSLLNVRATFGEITVEESTDFNLELVNNGVTHTLEKAVSMLKETEEIGLEAKISIPESFRAGRIYEGRIDYKNISDKPMYVPVFMIDSLGQNALLSFDPINGVGRLDLCGRIGGK